jgi:hypothetical protein
MVLLINVTAPLRAKALPLRVAALFMVMLWSAMIVPWNVVFVSRVAELVTCQNTLQLRPPPVKATDELGEVVIALPILNTQTSVALPLRVSAPVNPAVDEKQ